jgi:hypothetical protein
MIDDEDYEDTISYWNEKQVSIGKWVQYDIADEHYEGPVIECEWDKSVTPPMYQITFSVEKRHGKQTNRFI